MHFYRGVISFNGESVFGTGRRGRKEMPKFMGDGHIKSPSSGGRRKRISSSEGRSSDADIGLGSKKTFSGKRRDKIRVELHSGKQREYGEYLVYGKSSRGDTVSEGRKAPESEFLIKVVKEAIAGVELYDSEVKKSVRKAAYGLHLTKEAALTIASKEVSI
ncbi:hypothetical protein DM860_012493 [Cuscuta australis]|uniref:Uncharacterized protein n=1 Tax=Cuscuta australis TaxID=267555 RepID=A0A328DBX4_9ASTE|nr:hypothetical protein DM860_012493 [Cuscuta australis]